MRKMSSRFLGTVLVVIGFLYLLDNMGILDADWLTDNVWSIGLIVVGVWLVLMRSKRPYADEMRETVKSASSQSVDSEGPEDRLDVSEVFRSVRRDVTSQDFAGGRCSVQFGVLRLDLTQAGFASGERCLRLSCVCARLTVRLPKDLEYSVKANLVASGLNAKGERLGGLLQNIAVRSAGFSAAEKKLTIVASCLFGEIEVI
jgi:predicted membrane protein